MSSATIFVWHFQSKVSKKELAKIYPLFSVPPIIRKGPQAKGAEEGESVSFSCQVTGTSYPVTSVIWRKDYQYIKLVSTSEINAL